MIFDPREGADFFDARRLVPDMEALVQIRDFLQQRVDHPLGDLTPETRLDQIGVDSLTLLEMMFALEEKFGVRFPNDAQQPETVGQVIELVEKLRPSAVPG